MGRFRASWEIVKASWAVLRQDKELLWLPIISFLATLATIGLFLGGWVIASPNGLDAKNPGVIGYVLGFLMYLVLAFITIFFNAALIAAAHERLGGGDPTVGSALAGATSRTGVLLPWAIVSATVSIILKAIQERVGLIGKIVISIIGIAWALVTFLVLPILVIEGVSVRDALRRSKELFTRTWGEQVIGNAAISLISMVAIFAAVPVVLLGFASGLDALAIVGVVAFVAWLLVVVTVSAALSGIFQTVLYLYASTGTVPGQFPPEAVYMAFKEKPSRGSRFGWS